MIAGFRANRNGAAAVEFALVSGIFLIFLLFIICAALIEYLGQSLDFATQKAARQVMTGVVQTTQMSQAAFTNLVCSYLPAAISCADVIVNLYTVPYGSYPSGYYTFTVGGNGSGFLMPPLSPAAGQYSPGIQGNYEYLVVVYPVAFFPSALSSFLGTATYKGKPAYPVVATAAFRNEQY